MAMSWRVVFRPPDIASVLAMSKRYSVLPVAQIVGVTVPAGDADELARGIERLIGDAPARQAMGRNGEERHRRLYSTEVMVRAYESAYAQLAPDHGVRAA